MVEAAEVLLPPRIGKLWGYRDLGLSVLKLGTKKVGNGAGSRSNDSSRSISNGCRFFSSGTRTAGTSTRCRLVYTESPSTGKHNLGIYRMQRYDRTSTGMHWQIGKGGGFHYFEAEQRNEALPVTVFLGGPPALILSAIAPLPEDVPELMLASLIATTGRSKLLKIRSAKIVIG